jgi:hypothetical protein
MARSTADALAQNEAQEEGLKEPDKRDLLDMKKRRFKTRESKILLSMGQLRHHKFRVHRSFYLKKR